MNRISAHPLVLIRFLAYALTAKICHNLVKVLIRNLAFADRCFASDNCFAKGVGAVSAFMVVRNGFTLRIKPIIQLCFRSKEKSEIRISRVIRNLVVINGEMWIKVYRFISSTPIYNLC